MIAIILVEDNQRLRQALRTGLETPGKAHIVFDCDNGEAALAYCLEAQPKYIRDSHPDGCAAGRHMNGIQAAVRHPQRVPTLPRSSFILSG
jgi:DNA-binding NarL/FixJ family response regulator